MVVSARRWPVLLVTLLLFAPAARGADTLCDPSSTNCRTQLLTLIQNERVGIDVGFWFMQDSRYMNEIVRRWQAGVPVRIIMDTRANADYPGNSDMIAGFQQAGIPLRRRTASGINHWKMMLFAGQNTVEFGSANYSPDAFVPSTPYSNYVAETVFFTDDPDVVHSFKTKFDDAWTDTSSFADYANVGSLSRVYPTYALDPEMNFPPSQNYATRAVAAYNKETTKIDAFMFRITDERHTNAIIAAKNRGVPVRLIVDSSEYRNPKYPWDAYNVDRLYASGVKLRWQGHSGDNHEKLVLLYGQATSIFGSSNWTTSSANAQNEHNYFTTKTAIFQWFVSQFERMWNNSNSAGATETVAFAPLPPDQPKYHAPASGGSVTMLQQSRVRIIIGVVILLAAGAAAWAWSTSGHELTDDAQVDAHVTQMAARVGGTVTKVAVDDNQLVEPGTLLVQLDPGDYQVAVDKARAELADAEANAVAAQSSVPITSTTAASNVTTARGGISQAQSGVAAAEKEIEAARARIVSAQARLRETEANAAKSARDVERLRGLLAKDEISQQMFDAAGATAEAQKAAVDSARSQVAEAEAGVRVAESKLAQARAGESQAHAELETAQTGPSQVTATKARASAAEARVQQARASLAQAELNLQYTTVKAPVRGIVSKKGINVGQVIQAGQPLIAIVPIDDVWVTANFKETQLKQMRPGQRVVIEVDAYGREYTGKVDSIAGATGARFSLLPPENATGNFVKVVQRVPVKIVLDPGQDKEHLLRPGMSVTPTVYLK